MSSSVLLRLALPADESLPALRAHVESAGIDLSQLKESNVVQVPNAWEGVDLEVMILPTNDIGTYVERGVVQMGVLSTHLIEERQANVWRPFTFDVGQYPIILAGSRGQTLASLTARPSLRLATPMPGFTREWFSARGFDVEVVPVERSPRTAVMLGLAEVSWIDSSLRKTSLTTTSERLSALGHHHSNLS